MYHTIYSCSRRRYDRAEAEFIAAKLVFHRASEAKELLSEHLCTIIQEHEMRKAEKLSDLLKTLELENQDKDSPHLQSRVVSGNALFQKTPTPGTNIWPRERLGSNNEKPPIKRGTDSEQVTDDAKHHTVKEANDRLYDNLEQNRETGLISSSGCPRPEPLPSAANTQDTGADSDSDTPLITLKGYGTLIMQPGRPAAQRLAAAFVLRMRRQTHSRNLSRAGNSYFLRICVATTT